MPQSGAQSRIVEIVQSERRSRTTGLLGFASRSSMACEVRESAELGRYYVAARPVAAGEQARVGFPSGYGGVEGLERHLLPSGFGAEI